MSTVQPDRQATAAPLVAGAVELLGSYQYTSCKWSLQRREGDPDQNQSASISWGLQRAKLGTGNNQNIEMSKSSKIEISQNSLRIRKCN